MSQAKVDKYKKEKKNRAKIMKHQKIRKVILILIGALCIGAIIGIPLGKHIYKVRKEIEQSKRTIVADEYEQYFEEFWGKNFSDILGSSESEDEDDDLQELIDTLSGTSTDADEEGEDFDIEYDEEGDDLDIEYDEEGDDLDIEYDDSDISLDVE